MKYAVLFTGQGAQSVGMGKELYENCEVVRKTIDALAGDNIKEAMFGGPPEELAKTKILQPALTALSLAVYAELVRRAGAPQSVAGFSLGEMTALAASGMLPAADLLRLVTERGAVMDRASAAVPGAMYSIMGKEDAEVEEVCAKTEGYVVPVNYNCPGQLVISGEAAAAEAAAKTLAAGGARTVKLNVSGAFHTKLMAEGSGSLYKLTEGLTFNQPEVIIYSNVSGRPLELPEGAAGAYMADYIIKQMSNPVRFRNILENMESCGTGLFIEIGAGKVLSGFVKRTCKAARFISIEDTKSLAAAAEMIGG